MSLICSLNISAAELTRQSHIKSHGVLQSNSETQEVLLDSSDLTYLCEEMDRLEVLVDGLQMQQNPYVTYTYHEHIGDEYHEGGCHTAGYHVHVDSCPRHTESRRCGHRLQTHVKYETDEWGNTTKKNVYYCPEHHTNKSSPGTCSVTVSYTVYDCGSPNNRWALGCNRRVGEIEKAEIAFAPTGG